MITFTGKIFSSFQVALGLEPKGRKLTETETEALQKIFAGAVDLDKILIKEGYIGAMGVSKRAFTFCNTIYIPGNVYDAPGTPLYLQLLVHETVHVWQFQNGGTDYMAASVKAQIKGWWHGDIGIAYQYERGIKDGKLWAGLNPEQQARLIEDAYAFGLFGDANKTMADHNGEDITQYARAAIVELLAGQGAA